MNNKIVETGKEIILKTIEILNDNEKVLNAQGGNFNIFSILDVERKEVSTHSAFIFELINPKGSHKQNNRYLKFFVEEVLGIMNFDFSTASVYKEKYAGKYGRIDLFIESQNYKIVIEVKIDADDQPKQLQKYFDYLIKFKSTKQQYVIYYLTLNRGEPTKLSYGDLKEKDRKSIHLISFENDILRWLLECTRQIKIDRVNQAILQYVDIVKKITNNVDEEMEVVLKNLILNNIDNYKAALNIAETVKDARQQILDDFMRDIKYSLDDCQFLEKLIEDVNYNKYYSLPKNRYAHLTYLLKETQFENINIYFRIELEWRLYYSFWVATANDDTSIDWDNDIENKNVDAIKSEYFNEVDNILQVSKEKKCLGWNFFNNTGQKQYNFFEDASEYNVEYLVDKEVLKKEVMRLSKTIQEVIETLMIK